MRPSSIVWPSNSLIRAGFVILTLGVLLTIFSAPLAGQSPQPAYWRLDEAGGPNYADASGGNDAACVGDCPTATVGQVNGGQQFNGSSARLDAAASASFDWAAGDSFSVELWVQGALGQTCADSAETMIGKADAGTGMRWSLGCASATGNATFHLFDASGQGITLEGPAIHNGGWHHLVGVRDGASGRNILYVNGQEVAAASFTYAAGFASATNVNIGWLNQDGGYHFDGVLDEIALYNRALSPTEIGSHYYLSRGYTDLCTAPIRIMPLGDSITQGASSGVTDLDKQVAYRRDLWQDLQAGGYQVDFVGSLVNGEYYQPLDGFDPNHEGHSGWADRKIGNNIYTWLQNTPADVILLHIGTNDLNSDPADVEDILDEIDRYDDAVTVVLARIINRITYSQTTTDFNNNIEAMAQARIANGDKIIIVDMENGAGLNYTSYTSGGDMWDDLHPYSTGYTKMAAVWNTALATFLPTCVTGRPVITSTPATAATAGQPYSYNVEASGDPAPSFALTVSPAGMTIDAASGLISWTPDAPGSVDVTVEATNSAGSDIQSFTVTVGDALQPPAITSTPVTEGWLGEGYSYDVEATGNPAPTYQLTTAPADMTINATTGVIAWTPTAVGDYPVVVEAVNSSGTTPQSFTIVVDERDLAPTITSAPVTAATAAQPYSYDVEANGNPAPTFALTVSPAGMTIDAATGLISWTPDAAGLFDVTVEATNSAGTDSQSFTVTVIDDRQGSMCPADLLSYWALDEPAGSTLFVDAQSGFDATCAGSTCPTAATGQVAGAFSFDGNDKVNVPYQSNFDWSDTDSFSIELWINTTQSCSGNKVFIGKYGGGTGSMAWWLGCGSSNTARLSVRDNYKISTNVVGTTPINDGNWHHIAAVVDGANHQNLLYIDGQLEASSPTNYVDDFVSSSNLNIGYYIDGYYYNGIMDEVAVYNRALDATEVGQHYANGIDGQGYCTLAETGDPPIITSTPVTAGTTGQPYSYDVDASGDPAPTFALTVSPAGMTIDATTGLISWTPDAAGSFDVTVEATNSAGADSQSFTITVSDPTQAPTITSTPVTSATTGQPYSYDVEASGDPAPIFALTVSPTGMTIDAATGLISWTPANAGSFDVTVEATNNAGVDSQSFTVVVSNPTQAPVITSTPVTTGITGQPYSYDIEASGDPAPTFALTVSPAGMTIDATTGLISWTPANAGSFDVTVEATNSAGIDSQSFTVVVSNPTQAPVITSTPVTAGTTGHPYSYDIEASGDPAPTFALTVSPAGMTIDATTGVIAWTPNAAGSFDITVEATNSAGSDSQSFTVVVEAEAMEAPIFATSPVTAIVGQLYQYQAQASGTPAPVYSLAVSPVGMTIDTTSGLLSWTPTMAGMFAVTIEATNSTGTVSQSFSIHVSAPTQVPLITSEPTTTAVTGQPYSYDAEASGDPAPSFALTVSPAGMTIDASTGLIAWTPAIAGSFDVTVEATNSMGTDSQSFTVTVSDPAQAAVITSAAVTEATTGQLYNYDVEASGDPTPSFALTVSPASMAINAASGLIAWTPDTAGTFDVIVEASNSAGIDSQSFSISVRDPPVITSEPVTTVTTGEPYSYDVEASGDPAPTFALTVSPAGMTIDATTGLISWTSANAGSFDVTVEATNSAGADSQSFTVVVEDVATETPAFVTSPVTATVGQLYQYQAQARGTPAPVYSLAVAPAGMTIDTATGLVTWTPAAAGMFDVTIEATNSTGTVSQSFKIQVFESMSASARISPPSLEMIPIKMTESGFQSMHFMSLCGTI